MAEQRMRAVDAPQDRRLSILAGAVMLVAGTGCPRNVDGGAHSSKDIRYKGAKRIKLEDNEGRSRKDIVTYPGGDRVDWKAFEIGPPQPDDEKKKEKEKDAPPAPPVVTGTLKVTVRW